MIPVVAAPHAQFYVDHNGFSSPSLDHVPDVGHQRASSLNEALVLSVPGFQVVYNLFQETNVVSKRLILMNYLRIITY